MNNNWLVVFLCKVIVCECDGVKNCYVDFFLVGENVILYDFLKYLRYVCYVQRVMPTRSENNCFYSFARLFIIIMFFLDLNILSEVRTIVVADGRSCNTAGYFLRRKFLLA